jgi:DNA helicase-2/ATP-dependent DNA helicase PcrA
MDTFRELYSQLNKEQKKAVDATEGPLLVVAGPGTGKTQLLTLRVANILLKTDAQAHNILCLTFTESAAYEMRQRLVNIIGQSAYNITISTYHAFGSEIISRYGEYFGDVGELRPVDELGIHEIMTDIVAQLPYDNELKKSQYYIKDVISAVSECKRATIDAQTLRECAKHNRQWIEKVTKLTAQLLTDVKRITSKQLPKFEQLAEATGKFAQENPVKGIRSLQSYWQESLEEALQTCEEENSTKALTAWKNKWLERNEAGEYIVAGETTNKKIEALADIYEQYLKELKRQNLYDYDDMILRANSGLQENPALRYSLQEQYNYILLDEFQDTNGAQLQLVTLLSDSPVHERRPNIMAVGDDDQAIYAFQGADYSHMLAFVQLYKDVEIVCLTKNYRSHKDVLQVAHNITEQLEERLSHHQEQITKVLTAENTKLPKESSLERHEFKSDVAQFAWVTERISQLVANGTQANEIAILAPQHKYLEPIVNYLRQAKIPIHYDKRENILEDPHVLQIIRMCKLVIALGQNDQQLANSLWPEILSYDCFEVAPEKLWQLSWSSSDDHKPWTQILLEQDNKKLKTIASFFLRLGQLYKTETLETMIDYVVGVQPLALGDNKSFASPFYDYKFSKNQREENTGEYWSLLTNLTVLRQHLRENLLHKKEQSTLQDLITFIDAHNEANIKILNTSPYHESGESVQIMTAYRAKGLEFDHVFMLACVDEVWGSRAISQSSRIPLPQNLSFVRYQGASEDERRRLLFVAITRAKIGLYLTSYANNYANRPTSRLKYLNEVENEDGVRSLSLPEHKQLVIQNDSEVPAIEELNAYWHQPHIEATNNIALRDILKSRLDRYQLAPTHLNSFTDVIHGGPEYFLLNTILRFPKALGIDAEFGNAIHATLEWTHKQQVANGKIPSIKEQLDYYARQLDNMILNKHDRTQLEARGKACLTAYMKQRANSFNTEDLHEMSFKNQGVIVGNAHLSGKIDKLIIDRQKKQITVVDYKTGKFAKAWKSSDPKLHKYRQQLYMYKLLVEGSYEFIDYTVTDAYLEFVEPDEKGNIVLLHTTFEQDEMQRIKKLINAVWNNIKSLHLPDISNYPQNYQGVVSFEEDIIEGVSND